MTPASRLVDLARSHVGERYVLGVRVPKDDIHWHGPWDCAELATWAAYLTTGLLWGVTDLAASPALADAYSGAWARDARERPDRCVDIAVGVATPGVVLIRAPAAAGLSGHVAISTGGGGTVEAYSTSRGVVESTAGGRRWDFAFRVPGLAYGAPPADPLALERVEVLRVGDRGDLVRRVQIALTGKGYAPGPIDGIYGVRTAHAAAQYQRVKGLVADGEVGPITLRALGLASEAA